MLSNFGLLELIVLVFTLVFWVAVVAGVVKIFEKSTSAKTIATLVEENRCLREEIAALKGEKYYADPEV